MHYIYFFRTVGLSYHITVANLISPWRGRAVAEHEPQLIAVTSVDRSRTPKQIIEIGNWEHGSWICYDAVYSPATYWNEIRSLYQTTWLFI